MSREYEHVTHTFGPVFDENSKILILGSMPSVRSRQQQFYYGHPQNRFWRVISSVVGADVPETIDEKRELMLKNHIALWDVIESCDIVGSSDSSIKNVRGNDIGVILTAADIKAVFVNGRKAYELFAKYCQGAAAILLPSTSPANAAWSLERLTEKWQSELEKFL